CGRRRAAARDASSPHPEGPRDPFRAMNPVNLRRKFTPVLKKCGAGYGDRTRLTGLGSQGITTMLSPRVDAPVILSETDANPHSRRAHGDLLHATAGESA